MIYLLNCYALLDVPHGTIETGLLILVLLVLLDWYVSKPGYRRTGTADAPAQDESERSAADFNRAA